ncbi:MAG TPA: Flp pilus assembly protein CpaB [Bacilli bacterium]|nr:Flp pilus assembly protein CpaB [Bacilli bacterium]
MKRKGKWLVLSAVLALVTSYLLLQLLKSNAAEQVAAIPKVKVVVAATDIGERVPLDPSMLKVIEKNADQVHGEAISSIAELDGAVTRQPIVQDEVLLKPMLAKKEWVDGSLFAMKVPAGQRAVTIANSELVGVGGLLVPGDYVDVIGSFEQKRALPNQPISKILLQNIRVLAIGQQSRLSGVTDPQGEDGKKTKEKVQPQTTVTLAVEPEQAEALVYADTFGQIRLALRSVNDKDIPPTNGVTPDNVLQRRY